MGTCFWLNNTTEIGWRALQGYHYHNDCDFQRFREAAAFPKSMLHPAIADKVWLALARGDLDDAVFAAFKAVEEAVREAGGFGLTDYSGDLMRNALKPGGPLANPVQPKPEQEALAHLFAGAIGSYKNLTHIARSALPIPVRRRKWWCSLLTCCVLLMLAAQSRIA